MTYEWIRNCILQVLATVATHFTATLSRVRLIDALATDYEIV